jgi:hypothetical protein
VRDLAAAVAVPARDLAGPAVRDVAAAVAARVEVMREREAGEKKSRPRYYTYLYSLDRHISRRT